MIKESEVQLNNKAVNKNQKILENETSTESFNGEKEQFKNKKSEQTDDFSITKKEVIKENIEKDFRINLEDYLNREQVQFANFLSTKTREEVEKVKKFLDQAGDENNRKNRIKSFLSCEQDFNKGNIILSIGDKLENNPETADRFADRFFDEYVKITNKIEEYVDSLLLSVNEVYDEEIDRDEVYKAVFQQVNNLLINADKQLSEKENNEYHSIILDLLSSLKREMKIKQTSIQNISDSLEKIKLFYLNNLAPLNFKKHSSIAEYKNYIEKERSKSLETRKMLNPALYKDMKITSRSIDKMRANQEEMMNKSFIEMEKAISYQKIKEDAEDRKESLSELLSMDLVNDELAIKNALERTRRVTKEYFERKNLPGAHLFVNDDDFLLKIAKEGQEGQIDELKKEINDIERILLLCEELKEMLDSLLYNKESKLDSNKTKSPIFQKYQEIIDKAKNIRQNIKSFYKEEKDISEEEIDSITDSMLKRANDLLKDYSSRLQKGEDIDQSDFNDRLEAQRADTAVFASIFENAYRKDKIGFDELRGVDYKTKNSLELDDQEKEMIIDVIRHNYPDKNQQEDILEKIEKSFVNNQTKWHLLSRRDGKEESLVSCVRFDEIDEENVYAATFNVGVNYRGSKLGEAMFNHVMTEVAKTKKIHAIAEMGKIVSDFYINKGGFNVKGLEINQKTGKKYYKIERLDSENEFYGTKRIEDENELLAYYDEKAEIKDLVNIEKYILVKKEEADKEDNYESINFILKNDYLLTRTIKHNWKSYLVFEKKVSSVESNKKEAA